jgi:hypothetical protein
MKYLISVLIFISWILPIFSQVKSDTAINLTNPIHDNSKELMCSVKRLYASDTANNKIFLHYFKSYQKYIKRLNELPIDSLKNEKEDFLFRILCSPSFSNPICFTLSEKDGNHYLYWKIGKGAGGYEHTGVKDKGKKKLSLPTWQYFLSLIDLPSRDTFPIETYLPMHDGTSWTIENKLSKSNKVYYTNIPDTKLMDSFALFLHVSKCKIQKDVLYNRCFDRNNRIINTDSLKSILFNQLSSNLNDSVLNYMFSNGCSIQIVINSKERVSKVNYTPRDYYSSFSDKVDDWYENYKDRKYMRVIKKMFNNVNLSYLNLNEKIVVSMTITYNREHKSSELNKE